MSAQVDPFEKPFDQGIPTAKIAGLDELLVAQQMIEGGETTAKEFVECMEISEALLLNATARVRWDDPAFKKAS